MGRSEEGEGRLGKVLRGKEEGELGRSSKWKERRRED